LAPVLRQHCPRHLRRRLRRATGPHRDRSAGVSVPGSRCPSGRRCQRPTVLFAFIAGGPTAGIVTAAVFAVYTQIENHVLNPVVMSKTVRINPLLIFIAVLAGASLGTLIGGLFGGLVAALLAIPTAGALQVLLKEVWQATATDQPEESPAPAAEPADEWLLHS
jgi:hypothetical protein